MNKTIKLFLGLAIVAIAISCEKLETTPQATKSDVTFSATPSATAVAVAAKDSLSSALTLTWNDPKYAVGLAQTKFTIMVGAKDKNFANFQSKSFTGVLTGSLLGKEVNAFALKMGGVIGTPINLDVKVVSSQANNNETKNSAITNIAVTPYGDLTLTSTALSVTANPATASLVGATLNWGTALSGLSVVKQYEIQYAKSGTNFSSPNTSNATSFSKSFSQFDLNLIALGYGTALGMEGSVDFRIKATLPEQNLTAFSNIITVKVTPNISFNSIGVVGDATAGGWDTDTDMYRPDAANKPADWTVTLYLTGGKSAKFRADDKWVSNWGATAFPSGTAILGSSANVAIGTSGYYSVNFNVATGAYSFTPVTTKIFTKVGLIGAQSSPAWSSEFAMLTVDPMNSQVWTGTVTLNAGELKFRGDTNWDTSWGPASGTTATSLSGWSTTGVGNMNITTAGTYFVYINVATGEYLFGNASNSTTYTKLGIIGDATSGGWSSDTFLIQNLSNPYKWSGKVDLTAKEAKFRANTDWGLSWGNASVFPSGIANTESNNNIKIASAGTYQITYNSATREFSFTK